MGSEEPISIPTRRKRKMHWAHKRELKQAMLEDENDGDQQLAAAKDDEAIFEFELPSDEDKLGEKEEAGKLEDKPSQHSDDEGNESDSSVSSCSSLDSEDCTIMYLSDYSISQEFLKELIAEELEQEGDQDNRQFSL